MKKLLVIGSAVGLVAGLTAAAQPQIPHYIDWGTSSVSFTIPTADETWKFEVNEPDEGVLVDAVYGNSGTLTIDYPVGFCGLLQADASLNGSHVYGSRYTVTDCTVPTTTTTVPPTTTTTAPPASTTTTQPPSSSTMPTMECCYTPQVPTTIPPVAPQSSPQATLPNIPPAVNGATNGNG